LTFTEKKTSVINDYRIDLVRFRDYTKLQSGVDFVKDGHVYGFMPSWRKDLPKESK